MPSKPSPATLRAAAVNRKIRQGVSREAAEAYYDRPMGKCACGEPASTPRGRICRTCYLIRQSARVRGHYSDLPDIESRCKDCGVIVKAKRARDYCDEHRYKGRKKVEKPVKPALTPKPKKVRPAEPLPQLDNQPLPMAEILASGVTVTRVPGPGRDEYFRGG